MNWRESLVGKGEENGLLGKYKSRGEGKILIRNVWNQSVWTGLSWLNMTNAGKGKGKSAPLQAWSGPEGSRKLRFPDFMTTAQDCGKVVSLTHRPTLPAGNAPGTHFC